MRIAGQEGGVGAEPRHRTHFVDADIGHPTPALIVETVIAAFHVVRDQLIAPGHIRVDAKEPGALLKAALGYRAVGPAADRIAFAADIAIHEIEVKALAAILPGGREKFGLRGTGRRPSSAMPETTARLRSR